MFVFVAFLCVDLEQEWLGFVYIFLDWFGFLGFGMCFANVLGFMFCMYMRVYRRVFGFDLRSWFKNDLGIVCGSWDSRVYGLDPGMIIVPGWSCFQVLVGCVYNCVG